MIECKRCKKQYIGETKRTIRERFTEHRPATKNPSHANASAAVPTHFNLPDHSIEDMTLIPLELLQPTLNTAHGKAKEAYLIHRGQTLEPSGMNRRNERYICNHYYLCYFYYLNINCHCQILEPLFSCIKYWP